MMTQRQTARTLEFPIMRMVQFIFYQRPTHQRKFYVFLHGQDSNAIWNGDLRRFVTAEILSMNFIKQSDRQIAINY